MYLPTNVAFISSNVFPLAHPQFWLPAETVNTTPHQRVMDSSMESEKPPLQRGRRMALPSSSLRPPAYIY